MERDEAAQALANVGNTERRLAQTAHWLLWRHALFGVVEAMLVIAFALPTPIMAALFVINLGLLSWIVQDDKNRYGMFVSGWQKGRTKPLTLAMTVFVLICAGVSAFTKFTATPIWPAILACAATFIVCTIGSLWWERIYRAEMRAGAHR